MNDVVAQERKTCAPETDSPNAVERVWPLDILIVEDDDATRRLLSIALRGQDHHCRQARDGEEALRALQEQPADVVLSDWQMPAMSGLDLCRRARAHDDARYTYFIMLTSRVEPRAVREAMEAGVDDYLKKPIDLEELEARLVLASRVVAHHRRLREKASLLRRDSKELFIASRTDALTGVGSRLALEEELATMHAERARYGRRASLAVFDVDFFKQFNDRFGHVAGDEALRQVAQTIKRHVRASDRVHRYGGEEFVVLLPQQGIDEAAFAISRVRREVERLGIEGGGTSVLTVSAGLAELDDADATGTDWLKRADVALYRAKEGGRNRVESDDQVVR